MREVLFMLNRSRPAATPADHFAIHLIRGLASLYVVFFHINETLPYTPNWWTETCKLGYLGVTAFFIVSGYCIGLLEGKSSANRFLLSRLVRIYPAYWASVILALTIIFSINLIGHFNYIDYVPRSLQGVLAHGLLLLSPLTRTVGLSWVYWSLIVEIFFYLYFFLCLHTRRWRLACLLLPLLIYPWQSYTVYDVSPLFWLAAYPLFLVGYLMQRLMRDRAITNWLLLILILGFCWMTQALAEKIVIALVIGLLAFLPSMSLKPVRDIVHYFSSISYSLYLVHVPLACFLLVQLRTPWLGHGVLAHCAIDIMLVSLTVVFTGYFYRLIEKPTHQWAKAIFKPETDAWPNTLAVSAQKPAPG